jgi:hypothetical protein
MPHQLFYMREQRIGEEGTSLEIRVGEQLMEFVVEVETGYSGIGNDAG